MYIISFSEITKTVGSLGLKMTNNYSFVTDTKVGKNATLH